MLSKMRKLLTVLASFLCIHRAYSVSQALQYVSKYSGSVVTFDITIYKNDDTVTSVSIPDPTDTTNAPTGTSKDTCKFTTGSTAVTFTDNIDAFGFKQIQFQVIIDYTTTTDVKMKTTLNPDIGCTFTIVNANTGEFTFLVRGLGSLTTSTATDREYEIKSIGSDGGGSLPGSTSFQGTPPPLDTAAPTTAYTFTLSVVDSPAHADKTTLDLGKTAQLKFTMTINPYVAKMDFAGARVTNCIVDKVAAFNSPAVTFIGSDGCFDDVKIFDNVHTNVGFTRDGSSTTTASKTYIAYSPKFEMSAFTKNPINAANNLYFKCDVTPCLDDTDSSTSGQCGASHCKTARRKRDAHERSGISVIASVNVTRNGAQKTCNKCSETATFQASLSGLATITAAIFGLMTLSYAGARNTTMSFLQKHRKSKTGSFGSKNSYMSSCSITGSEVTSKRDSLPRKSRA